ncbi:NAD(P)H-dependent oxidoreductase [Bifidobacterium tsurumiense]|uniref:NAD(P)H-dependent oxidoreductase n=1 Tax=Bifidobacterium tsurumiense TaxID=356829 RepID=UPI001E3E5941|nr:NAD(P)H-dependent oxidoreductase [Bifidobacterium tsurumiense]
MAELMRTRVLVFHPDLQSSTVNKALAQEAQNNPELEVVDMYSRYPDFNIDVKTEQEALEPVDRIVLQFPVCWYSVPPLLKKWFDDVLTYGWAYGSQGTALRGKELLIAAGFGAGEDAYRGDAGYTAEQLFAPLHQTSNFIGTTWLDPFVMYGTTGIERQRLEDYVSAYVRVLSDIK